MVIKRDYSDHLKQATQVKASFSSDMGQLRDKLYAILVISNLYCYCFIEYLIRLL